MTTTSTSRWASRSSSLVAVVGSVLAACGGTAHKMDQDAIDYVMTGGVVLTMDPARPRAEALAIGGGRILAVGSDADARGWIGPRTKVIELGGRSVTPGLVDAHCHLYGLGKSLEQISLRGATSAEEAAATVSDAASRRGAAGWIEGRGWDQNLWSPPEFPTHELLDQAVPDQPVALRRIDGHALWTNARAMQEAGITRDTPDPAGGEIVRDKHGEPTGVFIDNAMDLVEAKIPPASATERETRILQAARVAVAAGLTGVNEMGIEEDTVDVYRALAKDDRLPLRVYAFLDGSKKERRSTPERPEDTSMFTVGGIKYYADGALGSRGAALLAPYSDDPGNSGLVRMTEEDLAAHARADAAAGWQVAVHAIGDRANREVLDAFATVDGIEDRRFRVEHAQIVNPADIPRFAALGVIASMQPTHATSDMAWAGERLGPDRLAGAYAWRSMLDAGVHVAFGSDFPIEEVGPLLGLYAAVTRQDAQGQPPGGWLPEQKLTLDEAVRAFTVEAAYASFADGRGVIAPGRVADLTVYDGELTPDSSLLETHIDLTIVGGRIVYDRAAPNP